jgi:protein-L-isoaspartate(D-aspartate) O-methyltransferase
MSNQAETLRAALVASLKDKGELTDARLEAAFQQVPRHLFLPELSLETAYTDDALPVKRAPDGSVVSSSSQPMMMAMMLRQLALEPGHNVLEIGAGTGYNAAIMQTVVGPEGNVTSVEIDKDLVHQVERHLQRAGHNRVRVVHADGAGGYAPRASYDRIIATAGVWDVPAAWVEQLKPRGVLVVPMWIDAFQVSAAFTREAAGTLFSRENLPCGFIRLRGSQAGPDLMRRVGSSSLILMSNAVSELDGAALHALLSEDAERNLLDLRLSASDYFQGFMPYLVLNLPADFTFITYNLITDQQAYGLTGHGFALLSGGSACFVPFHGHGEAQCFGAPDAYLAVQACLRQWHAVRRPGAAELRLRLIPRDQEPPRPYLGQVYTRQAHYLHAWQDS